MASRSLGDAVDVVVVADRGDHHADSVIGELRRRGHDARRLNLGDLRPGRLVAAASGVEVSSDGESFRIGAETTVWWYRAGAVDVTDLDADEAQLVADEAVEVLVGSIHASGARWVDSPSVVSSAESKPRQLRVAKRCGQKVPDWLITDDPQEARTWSAGRPVVAKALSAGVGIAPYVEVVSDGDFDAVATAPVLLQEFVVATADLRVVVVGQQAWVWRREREPETTDWRAVDPSGRSFSRCDAPELEKRAVEISSALGLTMSSQDWLETADGPVFLEANPQGAWYFLPEAADVVVPALADHLTRPPESDGEWPRPLQRLLWDLGPESRAPSQDGFVSPRYNDPPWIDAAAALPGALDVVRRAHDSAREGAERAEAKASRLVQVALTLVAVALALVTYQLGFAWDRAWPAFLTVLPVGAGVTCLALAAFEAQEVDRVGVYHTAKPSSLVLDSDRSPTAAILAEEERGRRLASWTSVKKHSDLMQAKAWFSRGLLALILAGLVAAFSLAATNDAPSSTTPQTTPSTQP